MPDTADVEAPQAASNDQSPKRAKAKARTPRKKAGTTAKRSAKKEPTTKKARPASTVRLSADLLPRRTLEQSLRVARALRETLAGGPSTWQEIADAMSITTGPQNKYYLWSAVAYNIVEKVEDRYGLSEIGRKILQPLNANEDREATVQAVLTPVVLSRFFTDYNGSPYPADEHIGNILERRYGIPAERIEEAKALLRDNGIFAGILLPQDDGTMFVRLDPGSTGIRQPMRSPADDPEIAALQVAPQPTEGDETEFDKICFVITPIGEDDSEQRRHANMVLKNVIEPVASDLGLIAKRADQIDRAGLITQQIFEYLAKSRLCVADLSFNNPNAFYELGVRRMCKLPTVQMIRKGDKVPFDVSQGRTIKIDLTDVYAVMDSVESAKKELRQQLRHALSNDYKGEDNPVNTYLPGTEVKLPR